MRTAGPQTQSRIRASSPAGSGANRTSQTGGWKPVLGSWCVSVLLAAVLLIGCNQRTPTPAPQPPPSPASVGKSGPGVTHGPSAEASSAPRSGDTPEPGSAGANLPDGAPSLAAGSPTGPDAPLAAAPAAAGPGGASPAAAAPPTVEPPTVAPPAPPPPPQPAADWASRPQQRFLLVTPQGPMLWAVAIEINGRPLREAYGRLLSELIRDADANRDGRTEWDELWKFPPIQLGYLGTTPVTTSQQQFEQKRQRDFDKNGSVNAQELEIFLMGQRRRSGPLQWNDNLLLAGFLGIDGTIWAWLDENEDGSVSTEETSQLAQRLQLLDLNGDRALSSAELLGRFRDDMQRRDELSVSGEKIFHALDEKTRWEELLYSLEQVYATSSALRVEDLRAAAPDWASLDQDGDEALSVDELRRLREVQPQFLVQLQFRDPPDPPLVKFWAAHGTSREVHQPAWQLIEPAPGGQYQTTWQGLPLQLSLDDFAGKQLPEDVAEKLLRRFDADQNQYLDPQEGAGLAGLLNTAYASLDSQADQMLRAGELRKVIAEQLRYGAYLVELESRFSTDVWGGWDTNQDGRLSEREWELAENSQGETLAVTPQQARGWAVQLVRGKTPLAQTLRSMAQQPDGPAAPESSAAADSSAGPSATDPSSTGSPAVPDPGAWLRAMDANQDGEVSWREFLGDRQQFETLDRDHDQYVEPAEVGDVQS